MKRARYGVIFFDPRSMNSVDAHQTCHAIFALTRDMNAHARFVCVPLGERGNAAGAENVLTWQTGYPWAVNLRAAIPASIQVSTRLLRFSSRGEADAALIIAGDPMSHLGEKARGHLSRIPTIVVGSRDHRH